MASAWPEGGPVQLALFEGAESAVADELRRINPDAMTPLEALNKLRDLKDRL